MSMSVKLSRNVSERSSLFESALALFGVSHKQSALQRRVVSETSDMLIQNLTGRPAAPQTRSFFQRTVGALQFASSKTPASKGASECSACAFVCPEGLPFSSEEVYKAARHEFDEAGAEAGRGMTFSEWAATGMPFTGVPRIRGRRPFNYQYAGRMHPCGVEFNQYGFPVFAPYAVAQVVAANRDSYHDTYDRMATEAVDFDEASDGYVWHHHQDGRTVQLVPKAIHDACCSQRLE